MTLIDSPLLLFIACFVLLWLAAQVGEVIHRRSPLRDDQREDFGVVLSATLTLLGLLIGFTFSMAINRYDQRKTYEEAEANAIGTEFVRADLLPAENAATLRRLLKKYLDQRILYYATQPPNAANINADTATLQQQLWGSVRSQPPTSTAALVISGMNDVLNAEGYTQAAWRNRIPIPAWVLMTAIAICCNLLLGYGARRTDWRIRLVIPIAVSIAFFLIADIDSPRGGTIRVAPDNLLSLSKSLAGQ